MIRWGGGSATGTRSGSSVPDNPIFGLGIDATKTQTVEAKDPHNSFLQAFLEGGLVGGIGFVTVFILAIVASVRIWRRVKRGEYDRGVSLLAVGSIGALFSVAAQLITENVLLNTIVWWYMNMALAALAVLAWRQPPDSVRTTPRPARASGRRPNQRVRRAIAHSTSRRIMTVGPRLSIGVPVFNGEDYIEEAIRSHLDQDFTDFEVIVSDNCSTDSTPRSSVHSSRRTIGSPTPAPMRTSAARPTSTAVSLEHR